MDNRLLRLTTRKGSIFEGYVQGNGGYASADVVRREVAIVDGMDEGRSRIYQPAPGECKVHMRRESWRAYDDPLGWRILGLCGLKVEEISDPSTC